MSSPRASELSELAALCGFTGCRRPTRLPAGGPNPHAREPRLLSSCPSPSPGRRRASPGQRRLQPALCAASAVSMASYQQSRIQAYLEKNKIGPLFEVRRWSKGCPEEGVPRQKQITRREGGIETRAQEARPCGLQVAATAAPSQVSWNPARLALPLPGRRQVSAQGPASAWQGSWSHRTVQRSKVTPKTLPH